MGGREGEREKGEWKKGELEQGEQEWESRRSVCMIRIRQERQ